MLVMLAVLLLGVGQRDASAGPKNQAAKAKVEQLKADKKNLTFLFHRLFLDGKQRMTGERQQ